MREYEIQVHLVKGVWENIEEWHESTLVEAKDIDSAYKLARKFALLEAEKADAKIHDYYAIDLITGEQS